MIGGDFGLVATARSMTIGVRSKKDLQHGRWHEHHDHPEWQVHDGQKTRADPRAQAAAAAQHGGGAHVHTLTLAGGPRGSVHAGGFKRQSVSARLGGGLQLNAHGLSAGGGLSKYMFGAAESADHTDFTPVEGAHAIRQPPEVQRPPQSKWVASAPTKEKNELLEDDHLKYLVGDADSDLMVRIKKCYVALTKLFESAENVGDGRISFFELKHVLEKFSATLAGEAEMYLEPEEQTHERKITQERFIDVFLPLALSVPTEVLIARTDKRASMASFKLAGPSAAGRQSLAGVATAASAVDKSRRSLAGAALGPGATVAPPGPDRRASRKSLAGAMHGAQGIAGMTGLAFSEVVGGSGHIAPPDFAAAPDAANAAPRHRKSLFGSNPNASAVVKDGQRKSLFSSLTAPLDVPGANQGADKRKSLFGSDPGTALGQDAGPPAPRRLVHHQPTEPTEMMEALSVAVAEQDAADASAGPKRSRALVARSLSKAAHFEDDV